MPRRRFTEGSPVPATAPPVKEEEQDESAEKEEVLPDSTDDVTLPVKEEGVKKEDDQDGAEKEKAAKRDSRLVFLGCSLFVLGNHALKRFRREYVVHPSN